MISVALVALDGRVSGSMEPLTYLNPHAASVGDVVLAPLGPRAALGVIWAVEEVSEADLPVSLGRMRALSPAIGGVSVPSVLVELATLLCREYLCAESAAAGLLIPAGIRDRLVSQWERVPGSGTTETLGALQQEVLLTLDELDGKLVATKSKPIAAAALRALRAMQKAGLVREGLSVQVRSERSSLPSALRLAADEAKIERFLVTDGRKKPAQALTIMRLQGAEGVNFSPQEVKALSGVTDQTLRALLKSGLLESGEDQSGPAYPPHRLSLQQSRAVDAIRGSILSSKHAEYLLYGVTGSGKTEVYLHAAAEALKQGRQVLFLVPEIALTAQVIGQLRGRFGASVVVLHSNLGPQERFEAWLKVNSGEAPIVLGARSALFAPLRNIGLIIVDEEHEQSYKQEAMPRYHAKSLARKLAAMHGATIVLGSATPSIESTWESNTGGLIRLEMPERAAEAKLPEVHLLNLADQYKKYERPALLATPLHDALSQVLERGEQAILFLNRRAYAPFLSCRECGHVWKCPNCAVSLAYHKRDLSLVCHYCDHREIAPDNCPQCEGERINAAGAGSERVEEYLKESFPTARVARLDRDVTRKKGVLEETFALMRAGEIDFLVGTQMVAKGLDFPGVTLVGVVLADTALHLPDFRASERTFQLMSQVAGRAGRGQRPGAVYIQTFSPDHPALLCAQRHDYERLFESLLVERELVGYPPFNRLVNLVFTGANRTALIQHTAMVAREVALMMPTSDLLGPVDCSLERLNNLWRRHILVKAPLGIDLKPIADCLAKIDHGKISLMIDVDPYTML